MTSKSFQPQSIFPLSEKQRETTNPQFDSAKSLRMFRLVGEHQRQIFERTDRMFAWLMSCQWLAGIAAALWISPKTWSGQFSTTHVHVWAALILGGIITSFPVFLALTQPGKVLTRHVIAVGQMMMSALLIHLSGGRLETHFHVFGSLAFLAFYRDWRVLISASVVVASDHFVRGLFWPQSVYGVLAASSWRWLEHAGWVLFEDLFLFISIHQNLKEMFGLAERQAMLETVNVNIERQVAELSSEIKERQQAEAKLEIMHRQLLESSRQAGMSEMATGVLHNVGNALNSVNVSSTLIADSLKKSRVAGLARAATLLDEHKENLGTFLTADPKGKQLPGYLHQLAEHLAAEQTAILKETDLLRTNIEHIKDIVAMQQSYSKISGMKEVVKVTDLVEDSLHMNAGALSRHGVRMIREFNDVPPINIEKHKVLQILLNLVRNAKYACDESGRPDKQITLRVGKKNGSVHIAVIDNGIGIPPENLTQIFAHGFTTRKDGHGFGLHSGALAAEEMGGSLTVHSDGPGQGAAFTLELPVQSPEPAHK